MAKLLGTPFAVPTPLKLASFPSIAKSVISVLRSIKLGDVMSNSRLPLAGFPGALRLTSNRKVARRPSILIDPSPLALPLAFGDGVDVEVQLGITVFVGV
jgi:hypothetical protein